MEWLRIFGVRFGGLFRKRNLDRDLDATERIPPAFRSRAP